MYQTWVKQRWGRWGRLLAGNRQNLPQISRRKRGILHHLQLAVESLVSVSGLVRSRMTGGINVNVWNSAGVQQMTGRISTRKCWRNNWCDQMSTVTQVGMSGQANTIGSTPVMVKKRCGSGRGKKDLALSVVIATAS